MGTGEMGEFEQNLLDYQRDPNNFRDRNNLGDLLELENIVKDIRTEINPKRLTLAGKNKKGELFAI